MPIAFARTTGRLLKQTLNQWLSDKAMRLSAAVAMYSVLSLSPLMVITIKIISAIFGADVASKQVQLQLRLLVGPMVAKAIVDMISGASKDSGIFATIVSIILLIFTASGVFAELQDDLNTVWHVKTRPSIPWLVTIKNRMTSIAMVFVIAFLLLVSQLVTTGLAIMSQRIAGGAGWTSFVIDTVVSISLITALFAMIFRVLPDVRIGYRDVLLGAFVTAVLFKLGQYVLALYFKYGTTASAYGAAGSFVAVLLWVYYSCWILFFGAEFTKVYALYRNRWVVASENAVPVTPTERAKQGMDSGNVKRET